MLPDSPALSRTRPSGRMLAVLAAAAVLWLLAAAVPARAEGGPGVVRVVSPSWPGLTNPDGTGLYFDILRAVYQPRGLRLSHLIVPWKRAKQMLLHRRADLLPAAYLTPDQDQWLYPRQPLDVDQVLAVRRAGGPAWQGQQSLEGRRVVWPRGYNFQNYLRVAVEWREINDPAQGWAMVAKGRADFYLDIAAEIQAFRRRPGQPPPGLAVQPVLAVRTYLRLARRPRARRLIAIYDQALPRLRQSGRLRELFERWGAPYPFAEGLEPRPAP
jgi:ABC-type amino acid transport substrate-binding protein